MGCQSAESEAGAAGAERPGAADPPGVGAAVQDPSGAGAPFVRTKTADEILDTLAAYCRPINNARH